MAAKTPSIKETERQVKLILKESTRDNFGVSFIPKPRKRR